jgi:hypothetical protein
MYKFFNEPNLSLKPASEETFRLIHNYALGGTTFITLTKRRIIVKQSIVGVGYNYYQNRELLSEEERTHLDLFEWHYPLDDKRYSGSLKRRLDSLTTRHPELLDAKYYLALIKKTIIKQDPPKIKYMSKEIPITNDDYKRIVSGINKTGFWEFPTEFECIDRPMDGQGYILEANTRSKYNYVHISDCEEPSSRKTQFAKACQELVKLSGLDKEISLYWDGKTNPADTTELQVQDIELENIKEPPKEKRSKKK